MTGDRLPVPSGVARRLLSSPRVLFAAFAALFAAQGLWTIGATSPTFDEAAHLPAGLYSLRSLRFDLYRNNPPLAKVWAAIPLAAAGAVLPERGEKSHWDYAYEFQVLNAPRYRLLFTLGRVMVLALGIACALFVHRWSRELWGDAGGAVSLLLFCFSPAMLSHAAVVTPDLPFALFFFLTVYLFRACLRRPSPLASLPAGVCLGLALLCKFTALALLPVLLVLGLATFARERAGGPMAKFSLAALTGLLVLNAGYLFQGVMSPLSSLGTVSGLFDGWPGGLRLPLPSDWILGLDDQLADNRFPSPAYFMGKVFDDGSPLWYYEPAAFLLKTTIPVLLLLPLGLAARAKGGSGERAWLALPPALLLLAVSLLVNLKIGLRYVLPVYPFVFVAAGGAASLLSRRRLLRCLLPLALAWHCVSSVKALPHHLSYFNELIGRNGNGYRFLADSDLDWGQDLPALRAFLESEGAEGVRFSYFGLVEPAIYGIASEAITQERPEEGWYAVSATHFVGLYDREKYPLQNIYRGSADFGWLKRYDPVTIAGNSILVFHVSPPPGGAARGGR